MEFTNEPINLSIKKRPVAVVSPSTNTNSLSKGFTDKSASTLNLQDKKINTAKTSPIDLTGNAHSNELNLANKLNPDFSKILTDSTDIETSSGIFNAFWNNNKTKADHAGSNKLSTPSPPSIISPILSFFENKQTLEAAHSHLDRYLKLTNQYLESNHLIPANIFNKPSTTIPSINK